MLSLLALAVCAALLGYSIGARIGYDSGRSDGHADGHKSGYDDGWCHGHKLGRAITERATAPTPAVEHPTVLPTSRGGVIAMSGADLGTLSALSPELFEGRN